MPRMYPATVRRQIVSRLRSGEAVAAIAAETGVCQATLFRWKRQALIDAGVIEGGRPTSWLRPINVSRSLRLSSR
jgi:transposase-like protein